MHPFIAYRKRTGLSQAGLAEILGISDAMVSHIETGKRPITAESAIEYESKLGGAITRHEMRPDIFGPAPSAIRDPNHEPAANNEIRDPRSESGAEPRKACA